MYSFTAASICRPVDAEGPVIGRIRPIFTVSSAKAAVPLPAARASAQMPKMARLVNIISSLLIPFGSAAEHNHRIIKGAASLFSRRLSIRVFARHRCITASKRTFSIFHGADQYRLLIAEHCEMLVSRMVAASQFEIK
jgi:hypothetical protein